MLNHVCQKTIPVPLAGFGTHFGDEGGILALRRRFDGSDELESLEWHTMD